MTDNTTEYTIQVPDAPAPSTGVLGPCVIKIDNISSEDLAVKTINHIED